MTLAARYEVVDLKFAGGNPAVLRHVDGSGFAYYPSGRKAICLSAHGADGKGKARRFSAIIHQDVAKADISGLFDEWGHGFFEGQMSAGDLMPPRVTISERSLTVVDGACVSTEVPSGRSAGSADITLRVNQCITVQHRLGRTSIAFQAGGVNHTFAVGELLGDEVLGMTAAVPHGLAPDVAAEIGGVTQSMQAVRDKVSGLKVDPSKGNAKAKSTGQHLFSGKQEISDVLATLDSLQQSLLQPGLAGDLTWNTEGQLKNLLHQSHPQCPGQQNGWTIARVSGKCTDERLSNAKATVAAPKMIPQVSQLKLPELIEDTKGTLLVVVCLASYALEQSNHAKLIAQRVHAELDRRGDDGGPLPVKMVSIELAEMSGFAEHYSIKEAPYCLMFWQGNVVHSKRMSGMQVKSRDPGALRPRVLLVEPNPGQQLKLERGLRRSQCSTDLAMDGASALRLAGSRQQPYTVLLASATLPVQQLRAIADKVRQELPAASIVTFDAGHGNPDDDPDARQRFLQDCQHVFPYVPGYTALEAVLARPPEVKKPHAARPGTESEDFAEEVLAVLQRAQGGTLKAAATEGGA